MVLLMYYKDQPKGPQDRCHERGDELAHEFFVAIDVPSSKEYASYKDSSVFLDVYDSVPEVERCFFEQIREGKACKEYYDIDWTLASSADEGEIKKLEQQVFTAFLRVRNQHAPEFALDNEHCRVLSSSNSEKLSLHIVIPTMVFENNNRHMKAFILRFQETWKSALCDKDDAALLKRIDKGVYSKNRNMRILGSHKFLDPTRPLQRAEWHVPSMLAEDEEFLITAIEPDSINITRDLQEVAVERAPSTVTRKTREAIQSCLPKFFDIPECIGLLVPYLNQKDVSSFARTSREKHRVWTPSLYRTLIVIYNHPFKLFRSISALHALVRNIQHVRNLTIEIDELGYYYNCVLDFEEMHSRFMSTHSARPAWLPPPDIRTCLIVALPPMTCLSRLNLSLRISGNYPYTMPTVNDPRTTLGQPCWFISLNPGLIDLT
ncbi:hypothetical protein BGZ96_009819 [Linnemannia gamsii]|uniref:DNA-directed primase/polymerase protein n=1 Tax=Linnemannia gamsii TaxID=64522 RepID=A0ABQ7JVP8_9FUNG|nr:hypothetical protein BGZ96_009819 [Linnemannia gamsii]